MHADYETLKSITSIEEYLEALNALKDRLLIAFAVKDTPGINLKSDLSAKIRNLGFDSDLAGKGRHAWVGLIDRGQVLVDELSERDGTVKVKKRISDALVAVESSGYGGGNRASIVIEGMEYACNLRGLNVVAFDVASCSLVDAVTFDTHLRTHPARRREEAQAIQAARLENAIARLERKEQKLEKLIAGVTKKVETESASLHMDFSRLQMMLWNALPEAQVDVNARKRAFFESLPKATGALRKTQAATMLLLREFDRVMREKNIQYWLGYGTLLGAVRAAEFIPWDDDVDICMMRSELPRVREALADHGFIKIDEFYWLHKKGRANMDVRHKIRFKAPCKVFMDIFVFDDAEYVDAEVAAEVRQIKLEMSRKARAFYQAKYPDTYADTRKYVDAEFGPMWEEAQAKVLELYGDPEKAKYVMWGMDNLPSGNGYRSFFPREWVFPLVEMELCGRTFPAPRESLRILEKVYGDPWQLPADMFGHQHYKMGPEDEASLDRILAAHSDVLEGFDMNMPEEDDEIESEEDI